MQFLRTAWELFVLPTLCISTLWWVLKITSRWSVGLRHLNKIVQTVVGADRRDAPLKEIRRLRRVRLGDPHLLHLPRNLTRPIFRTHHIIFHSAAKLRCFPKTAEHVYQIIDVKEFDFCALGLPSL